MSQMCVYPIRCADCGARIGWSSEREPLPGRCADCHERLVAMGMEVFERVYAELHPTPPAAFDDDDEFDSDWDELYEYERETSETKGGTAE